MLMFRNKLLILKIGKTKQGDEHLISKKPKKNPNNGIHKRMKHMKKKKNQHFFSLFLPPFE